MPETDPFGRAKGDDPLADMGWSASQSLGTESGPVEVAPPETPDRAARREQQRVAASPAGIPGERRRRRTNAGCAFAVVVVGFIVTVFGIVIAAGINAIEEGAEDIERVLPTVPGPAGDAGEPPRGLAARSVLRRDNLAPALRRLERVTGSDRLQLVRVDATRVLVTAALSGGRLRVAHADWQGDARVLSTAPAGGGQPSFRWSQIDPAAPERIVRFATRRRRASAFDYAVLTRSTGLGFSWTAFLRNGARFTASPDGRDVNRAP